MPAGYEAGDELPYFVRPSKDSSTQYGEGIEVLTGYQEYQFTAVNPKIKTININVEKIWEDNEDADKNRPTEITVELWETDGSSAVKTLTLNAGNNWKGTFKNLPKYEADGTTEIQYTVKEVTVTGYESEVTGNMTDGFKITNTPEQTSVKVTKAWEDNNNQDGIQPESITVKLLADGEDTGESLKLNEKNGWTGMFTDLDEYRAGEKIEYTITEDPVKGYDAVITGNAQKGFTVTNSHTPAPVREPGGDDTPDQPAKTGDAAEPAKWLALLGASAVCVLFTGLSLNRSKRRRRK